MALTKVRGAGAEGLTLSSTALTVANGLTLTDGDIALASGHGLSFASNSNASGMSTELLDDFEEGTFTPVLSSEGSNAISVGYAGTPGSQYTVGSYTKVGNTVHYQITVDVDSYSGGSSNNLLIGGLPFTSSSYITTSNGGGAVIYNSGHNTNPYTGIILGSQTNIRLYRSGSSTASQTQDFTANSYVQTVGSYKTDS